MNKASMSLAAALCFCALPALATVSTINLIQNPGFEAAASGWQSSRFTFGSDALWAHSGPGEARTGCVSSSCVNAFGQGAYLRQLLPTVIGEHYDLSFWVRSYAGVGEFSVFWDGARIDDRVIANGPMLFESYPSLTASSGVTSLEIHGRNDDAYISFDDFLVMQSIAPSDSSTAGMVPEPLTWPMLAAGLGLLAVALRRA